MSCPVHEQILLNAVMAPEDADKMANIHCSP